MTWPATKSAGAGEDMSKIKPASKVTITVEFSASGTEMPEHIEAFLQEKYEAILRGASGRKFIYKEGEWRLIFTFFPTDRVVDERYALKNKVQMINKVQMKSKS